MKNQKAMLVGAGMFTTIFKWTIWYASIFLLCHIILAVVFVQLEDAIKWTILDSSMGSTRIYFLIVGIMSMGGFLSYFVSNGVTRRDYFIGTVLSLFAWSVIFTVFVGLLYGIENWVFFVTGWDHLLLLEAEDNRSRGIVMTLFMFFFQLVLFYLIGWFISAGFYKFNWLLGLGFIVLGVLIITIFDGVWGENSSPTSWFEWIPFESISTVAAAATSVALIVFLLGALRWMTKNAEVEA